MWVVLGAEGQETSPRHLVLLVEAEVGEAQSPSLPCLLQLFRALWDIPSEPEAQEVREVQQVRMEEHLLSVLPLWSLPAAVEVGRGMPFTVQVRQAGVEETSPLPQGVALALLRPEGLHSPVLTARVLRVSLGRFLTIPATTLNGEGRAVLEARMSPPTLLGLARVFTVVLVVAVGERTLVETLPALMVALMPIR